MKKTFITKMPDKSGAFLKASRIISETGANITRVSYNKAVDVHMLFIEIEGSRAQLNCISKKLIEIGYISNEDTVPKIILIEFRLLDVPGAVLPILELINNYSFNISYISSKGDETDYQDFKMGLVINDPNDVKSFLDAAAKLCEVKIIDYDESQKILDNTVFYLSFANQVATKLGLDKNARDSIIADSNLIMQMLDEKNRSPYKTFKYIGKFADMLFRYKEEYFNAKVSCRNLGDGFILNMIEPPCGSNTYILEKEGKLLFIDCGFACFKKEMLKILNGTFPRFADMEKDIIITHPDIDHCGLLNLFGKVYVSRSGYENFRLENNSMPNYREQNELHAPYCRISKILSSYTPPDMETLCIIEDIKNQDAAPVCFINSIDFCGTRLDIYEGNGGHVKGEIIIVSEEFKLVFSGDIVVNISGFSREQAEFNRLAPYLMTSVNMDSVKATEERMYLQKLFKPDKYSYFCGHGAVIEANEKN